MPRWVVAGGVVVARKGIMLLLLSLLFDFPSRRVGVVLDALSSPILSFLAALLAFDGGVSSRCSPCFVRRGDRRVDGDAMIVSLLAGRRREI